MGILESVLVSTGSQTNHNYARASISFCLADGLYKQPTFGPNLCEALELGYVVRMSRADNTKLLLLSLLFLFPHTFPRCCPKNND